MTHTQEIFLDLVRCGLWGQPLKAEYFGSADDGMADDSHPSSLGKASPLLPQEWKSLADMASEQTVTGVVFDALLILPKTLRPPKNIYYNMVARVGEMEDGNYKMNQAIGFLFQCFSKAKINAFLIKGQAAARFYAKPHHRQYGDIDILVPDAQEFEKAVQLMQKITGEAGDEESGRLHVVFMLQDVCVEIQGLNVYGVGRRCYQHYMAWARESLAGEKQWLARLQTPKDATPAEMPTPAVLPPVRFELMFIFVHLMNHFFDGGVGLRQVCDWMCYLSQNQSAIDVEQLASDLERLGLKSHWQTLASVAVCFLGAPKDKIPFYSTSFDGKARIALNHIFRSGNFGTLRTNVFENSKKSTVLRRFGTLLSLFPAYGRVARLFPLDAGFSFYRYALKRLSFNRKKS